MKIFSIAFVQTLIAQIASILMFKFYSLDTVGAFQKIFYSASLVYSLLLIGSEQSIMTKGVNKEIKTLRNVSIFYLNFFFTGLLVFSIIFYFIRGYSYVEYLVFIVSAASLYLIKIHQTFVTLEKKLFLFYKRAILISIMLIVLYALSFYLNFDDLISLGFIRAIVLVLMTYYIFCDVNFKIKYKLDINIKKHFKILKKDRFFIILFTLSNLFMFCDKILLADLLDDSAYANYIFNFSIASFFFLPKMILSNQYINDVHKKNFTGFIIKNSFKVSVFLFLFFVLFYFPVINFLKLESNFILLIIIYFLSLIELAFGPNGLVLQIKYNVKKLIFGEFLGLLFFLIFFYTFFSMIGWKIILISFFFLKTFINFIRFVQLKYINETSNKYF